MRERALNFHTIDLERHADLAVAFRRDSYICSFGADEAFGAAEDYLEWLRKRIIAYPRGHVHAWCDGDIVGQLEMRTFPEHPVRGYINLFYLVPEARGLGLGDALHQYAYTFMRDRGARRAGLHVSPTNARALGYYRKHGWRDCGPKLGDSSVHVMELDID